MRNLIRFLFFMWMTFPILSQPINSIEAQQAPQLTTTCILEMKSLILTNYCAHVTINGFIAETNITMTFLNPNDLVLEGEFIFPLPQGSFLSGYALDINGVMVDGVVVEKQKGRVVFEKIVRQGVDPGLVEWVEGNSFKTRIFPIPAKGTRTISVKYLSEVEFINQQFLYYLPLNFKTKINDFSIRIETVQAETKPVVMQGEPGDFEFSRWKSGFMAEVSLKDFKPKRNLVIQLPHVPQKNIQVEKDSEGDYYFSLHHCIDESRKIETFSQEIPTHITILWDASGSRRKGDHQSEIQLLKAYFSNLNRIPVQIDLILFHHKREKAKRFSIDNTNVNTLVWILSNVQYDGGTSLSAISPEKTEETPDFYLLFSDGKGNWDYKEPSGFKAPVFAISNSNWANHSMLEYITRKFGGMYFNLNKVNRETILKKIGTSPYSFISATIDSGIISDIYPQPSQPVNKIFTISGKLQSPQAKITLNYGFNNKIIHRESFKISREKATQANLIRTFWAQKKIDYLQIFPGRRREMVETGKRYGLVTPGTSLIVLDSLEQYLEHHIVPPKSLPQMHKDYLLQIKKKEKERKEKMDYLVNLWNERVNWWETNYCAGYARQEKSLGRMIDNSGATFINIEPGIPINRIKQNSPQYITGKVVLENGVKMPGVKLTLILRESDNQWVTISKEQGEFIFNEIPSGIYDLKAELEGFKTVLYRELKLESGGKLAVDILMLTTTLKGEVSVSAKFIEEERVSNVGISNTTYSSTLSSTFENSNVIEHEKSTTEPEVSINKWNPEMPYLDAIKQVDPKKAYLMYLEQVKEYGSAPSFYLDCAGYFFKAGKKETGIRVLSNISEMAIGNPNLLRVLGYRLSELLLLKKAVIIFEKVLEMKPEEPQSYRDLALVLAQMKKYGPAVDLLIEIINREWDDRFEGIEIIALMEVNNILAKARRAGIKNLEDRLDSRLRRLLDVDIRIVLTWDADMTDIDLWVTDPKGEKSYYGNELSQMGGLISYDFTEGYGPEEYLLKKAVKGEYKIMANFFGDDSSKIVGAVTLKVDVFTNYGRKSEKRETITVRLKEQEEIIDVGTIQF